jgi:hypothetical protein
MREDDGLRKTKLDTLIITVDGDALHESSFIIARHDQPGA